MNIEKLIAELKEMQQEQYNNFSGEYSKGYIDALHDVIDYIKEMGK